MATLLSETKVAAGLATAIGVVVSSAIATLAYKFGAKGASARNVATPGGYKFPAGSNFPDLKLHNNVMATVLRKDPGVSTTP